MNLPTKIGILGFGLIGGSIAKALKKTGAQIGSMKRNCADLKSAEEAGFVDEVFATLYELTHWAEVIFICTPLSKIVEIAHDIAEAAPKNRPLLVLDVSSVKKEVFPVFEKLTNEHLSFLSTHPMAGKETSGFSSSDAELFQGCCWILTPNTKNTKAQLKTAKMLIESCGAHSIELDPKKHDRQAALISHLPALISRQFLDFVKSTDPEALQLAGPGFHSMTRLAKDNPEMQSEIALLNSEELRKQFQLWIDYIT